MKVYLPVWLPDGMGSPGRNAALPLLSTLLVACWSSGFVGAELAARAGAPVATTLAWRFAVLAAVLVIVVVAVRGSAQTRRDLADGGAWRRQSGIALLTQVVYLGLVFEGVAQGVPGGTAALLAALQPIVVATAAGPLLGERTVARQWLGLIVGLVGVVVVVSGDLGVGRVPLWAFGLPVVAMLALSAGTVTQQLLEAPEPPLVAVTMQACVCAVAFWVVAALGGGPGGLVPPAETDFWGAVGWLVVLSSLGGYGTYVLLTGRRGAAYVSTLLYLTPPTTSIWVFTMFGDPVPVSGMVGMGVTALGVALYGAGRRTTQQPSPERPAVPAPRPPAR